VVSVVVGVVWVMRINGAQQHGDAKVAIRESRCTFTEEEEANRLHVRNLQTGRNGKKKKKKKKEKTAGIKETNKKN
jgi:hypothetical protein